MSSAVHDKPTQLTYFDVETETACEVNPCASSEQETTSEMCEGVAVDLAQRAIYLLGALDFYSKASSKRGFAIASVNDQDIQRRYSKQTRDDIISRAKDLTGQGNESFRRAWGCDKMADTELDPVALKFYACMDRDDFTRSLVGPGNKLRRSQYRKKLQKQIDRLNND